MNDVSERVRRLFAVLPILTALAFHAVALDRWPLALPVGLTLLVGVMFDWSVSPSKRRWYIAGGIGLLAGSAMLAVSVPPSGPLSPALVSALTGMLVGFIVLGVLSRNVTAAWISAWLLVALSGNVEMSRMLSIAMVALMAASLIGAATLVGVLRAGPRAILPLSLFAALVVLATSGIAVALKRLDGAMLMTFQTLLNQDGPSTSSGISREITIHARSSITLSQRPLLELSAPSGLLRAHAMDHFDGRRWSTSSELRSTSHTLADVPIRPESVRRIEMTLLDDLSGVLPSPAGTWAMLGAKAGVAGGWVLRGEADETELTVVGDALERLPSEEEPAAGNLTLPEDLREKLAPLAEQLTSAGQTSRVKTERIESFFQDNFEYSLETNLIGTEHPLVTLVRERRPAYCIYFASAMAVMLRSQGIPARLVSGFVPVEVNPLTGRVMIRQRDAHAWTEAWLEEEGRFVAFDPTPGGSRQQVIGQAGGPGFVSALVGAARSILRRAWLAFRHDPAGSLTRFLRSPISWMLLAGLMFLIFRYRRTKRTASADLSRIDSPDPLLREIYGRYVRSLRRAGVAPQPWETDDDLIARLAETTEPAFAATAKEFIARYRRVRFGGEAVDKQLMELAKMELTTRSS